MAKEKTPLVIDKTTGIRITIGAIASLLVAAYGAASTFTSLQSDVTHAQGDIVDLKILSKEQQELNQEISSKLSAQNQNIKDIKSDVTDIKEKVYK